LRRRFGTVAVLAHKEWIEKCMKSPSNFERLVLGCIDSYDSDQIVILQHFYDFFEIYKICILLHRSVLKISAKKIHPNFCRNEKTKSHFLRVFRRNSRFLCEILMNFNFFVGISQKCSGNDKMTRDFEKNYKKK